MESQLQHLKDVFEDEIKYIFNENELINILLALYADVLDLNIDVDFGLYNGAPSIFGYNGHGELESFTNSINEYGDDYYPDKYDIETNGRFVEVCFKNSDLDCKHTVTLEMSYHYNYTKQQIPNLDRFYKNMIYKI